MAEEKRRRNRPSSLDLLSASHPDDIAWAKLQLERRSMFQHEILEELQSRTGRRVSSSAFSRWALQLHEKRRDEPEPSPFGGISAYTCLLFSQAFLSLARDLEGGSDVGRA